MMSMRSWEPVAKSVDPLHRDMERDYKRDYK